MPGSQSVPKGYQLDISYSHLFRHFIWNNPPYCDSLAPSHPSHFFRSIETATTVRWEEELHSLHMCALQASMRKRPWMPHENVVGGLRNLSSRDALHGCGWFPGNLTSPQIWIPVMETLSSWAMLVNGEEWLWLSCENGHKMSWRKKWFLLDKIPFAKLLVLQWLELALHMSMLWAHFHCTWIQDERSTIAYLVQSVDFKSISR